MKKNYPYYPVDEITSLRHLVSNAAMKWGEEEAYAWFEGELVTSRTFNQFQQDINSLGTALYHLGFLPVLGKKEILPPRIAIIGENSYDWIVSYFAVTNGGNVVVPIDRDLPEEGIRTILEESGASAIIYSDSYANIFDNFKKKKVKALKTFINMRYDLPGVIAKGRELLEDGDMAYLEAEIDVDRTTAIIFTSGTTGLAKGVELTHKGLTHTVVAGHKFAWINGDTVLVLPLHHTYGFGATVISAILRGKKCFINSELKHVLRDINEGKPEFICVVPLFIESFYKNIMSNIKKQGKEKLIEKMSKITNGALKLGIDLRRVIFKQILNAFGGNLAILVSGGAPLNADLVKGFSTFGILLLEGYGITECSPIVTLNRNKWFKAGSVGLPLPEVQVRIDHPDEEGHGEICVKGPIVMNGYYRRPDITETVLKDGWFSTGDIGHIDEDGFVYITGRKKNLIILANGKNIHPEELEDIILKREEVAEVVVSEMGKHIGAEIFPNFEFEGFVGLEKKKVHKAISRLMKEINKDLPIYKRIKDIEFRDAEFPKTTTKKIKRW